MIIVLCVVGWLVCTVPTLVWYTRITWDCWGKMPRKLTLAFLTLVAPIALVALIITELAYLVGEIQWEIPKRVRVFLLGRKRSGLPPKTTTWAGPL